MAVVRYAKPLHWIELLKVGRFHETKDRAPTQSFLLDEPNLVISRSLKNAPAGLPIKFAAKQTWPKAGRILDFRVQHGAIWGRVNWNVVGEEAIASGEYRYVSTEFRVDHQNRVTDILGVRLDNNPTLRLSPIAIHSAQRSQKRSQMTKVQQLICDAFHIDPAKFLQASKQASRHARDRLSPAQEQIAHAFSLDRDKLAAACRGSKATMARGNPADALDAFEAVRARRQEMAAEEEGGDEREPADLAEDARTGLNAYLDDPDDPNSHDHLIHAAAATMMALERHMGTSATNAD